MLKEFARLDYRGLAAHLADHPDLGALIDLKAVPHYTTFQKAAQRLLVAVDFDAEWLHEAVRPHGVRTIIPPTRGRPSIKPPAGRWRRVMKQRFARLQRKYGQRWQVEAVNSMIKRRLGSALRARVEANQFREISLRAIMNNVMIIRIHVLYRAIQAHYRGRSPPSTT